MDNKCVLIEGINEVKKYFPLISDNDFNRLIELDPTYPGGDELGTYGKWILGLYNNFVKDKIALEKWEEQKKQGKNYPQPEKKSQEQIEDFLKLPNLLQDFDNIKNKAKLNINNIKSVAQLYQAIESVKSQGISTNTKVQRGIELFKKSVEKGGKVVFKDNKWAVLVPETFESSKVFGEDTNWCTTASNGNYYNYYLEKYGGKYFINLDLETGDLYQFHFESDQFMDSSDDPIELSEILSNDNKLGDFYINILKENKTIIAENDEWVIIYDWKKYTYLYYNISKTEYKIYQYDIDDNIFYCGEDTYNDFEINEFDSLKQLYSDYIFNFKNSDTERISNFLTDLKDIKKDEKGVFGILKFEDIASFYDSSRGNVHWSDVYSVLRGDTPYYFYNDYDDYSLQNYQPDDWDELISPYKLSWRDIVDIYDGDYTGDKVTKKQAGHIQYALMDDCTSIGLGIQALISDCHIQGSRDEMEQSIISTCEDNLPIIKINDSVFNDDNDGFNIYITYDKIKEILIDKLGQGLINDSYNFWVDYINYHDSREEALSVSEPYYGWDGFDDDYYNNEAIYIADTIKKILENPEYQTDDENKDDKVDDEISEVLKLSGISLNEVDTNFYKTMKT